MRDIKRRIKSIKGTQQITKAMNLVSASKLGRSRNRLYNTRPYYKETHRIIANVVSSAEDVTHPFIVERSVKKSVIILLAGDRGLCGGFNSNVIKEALNCAKNKENVSFISVGRKATDQLVKRNKKILKQYTGISESPIYEDASIIGDIVVNLYQREEVDEVLLVYTQFANTISHVPTVERILPVDTSILKQTTDEKGIRDIMIYEPSEEGILTYLVPKYINTIIYGAMFESATCMHGASMVAMDAATKNAGDAIESMTILYNRARQGAITQEITEIVGGANALN
jgi:F-type H+-transporting ATPase subunit gamma